MSISDPAIITLFRDAPSPSRHEFLKTLSSHFHPSDWNYLHGLLCNRSYYIDFLTLLPPEISLQIMEYLPREQIVLLRRVSRRWHSLLTSPEICRSLAHYFFPHLAATHLDPVIHFDNIVSRRLSFMRAEPSYTEELCIEDPTSLHADTSTLAFVTNRNQIQVRHLSDPLALKFPPTYMDDRSQVTTITLSASLVAAISGMGFCQVWDLSTHATHSFKIPSSRVCVLHSDGNTIGIRLADELIIHNAATNKTRSFSASKANWIASKANLIASIIVHEANNRIWTVKATNTNCRSLRITSRNLETGDTIGAPEEFALEDGDGARYAGNGVWNIGSFVIKIPAMSIKVFQIRIDVAHTQTVSFKSYSVALPHVPPWTDPPELSGLSLRGNVETWGDFSWVYAIDYNDKGRKWRISWDHSTLQGRTGSSEGWQFMEDCDTTTGYNDSFMVTRFTPWDEDHKGGVMRFDGIHERSKAATVLVTDAD